MRSATNIGHACATPRQLASILPALPLIALCSLALPCLENSPLLPRFLSLALRRIHVRKAGNETSNRCSQGGEGGGKLADQQIGLSAVARCTLNHCMPSRAPRLQDPRVRRLVSRIIFHAARARPRLLSTSMHLLIRRGEHG